jgi:glycosyltransferase involved in cell wall biosynthesis
LKIALFTEVFLPKIDGITNRLSHTLRELRQEGHEVLIFAPQQSVESFEGYRVVRIGGLPFPRYPGLQASFPSPRLLSELKAFQPDLVHVVGPACLGIWGTLASRLLHLPLIASYHTDFPAYMPLYGLGLLQGQAWNLIRLVHRQALRNLCPSRHTMRELAGHGVEHISLWRGGVDTTLFHPKKRSQKMRQRLSGGHSRSPLAVYVGRLGFEKHLDRLQILLRSFPQLRLAFVGDGPARAQLELQYQGDRVVFAGFLQGEELAEAYASADIFVMPSTTETMGFVTLEAMSSQVPVLAAKAGGTTDLIQNRENGLLYDPHNSVSMVEGMRELLQDKTLRQRLAAAGRQRAEQQSWRQETLALLESYRQTVTMAAQREIFGPTASQEIWARIHNREPFAQPISKALG